MDPKFKKRGEIRISDDKNPPSFVYIAASTVTSKGAVSTSDGKLYVFDSDSAQVVSTFQSHDSQVTGICISDRSQIIGSCCEGEKNKGNEIKLWDMRTLQLIGTFYLSAFDNDSSTCNCMAINNNGTIVAGGADSGVLLWDARKPEGLFRSIKMHPEEISSIEFHPFTQSSFLAGDDDGNLLLYDLDCTDEEDAVILYANDAQNPCFQCGFCGVDTIFSLRRTAGMRLWNIFETDIESNYDDIRLLVDNCFSYPIDAHWCGQYLMMAGGDQDGGVALVLVDSDDVKLFHKIEKAHDDCVNSSFLETLEDGSIHLYLAGDGGQLSFWHVEAS